MGPCRRHGDHAAGMETMPQAWEPCCRHGDHDTLCQTDESISMKGLMLRVMGVIDPRELDRQHDAAECLRSLLSVTNEMSFLWHHIEETLLCENCGLTTPQIFPWSIAAVDISSQIQGNRIDIAQSIVNHFDGRINAFGSACPSCHAEV